MGRSTLRGISTPQFVWRRVAATSMPSGSYSSKTRNVCEANSGSWVPLTTCSLYGPRRRSCLPFGQWGEEQRTSVRWQIPPSHRLPRPEKRTQITALLAMCVDLGHQSLQRNGTRYHSAQRSTVYEPMELA